MNKINFKNYKKSTSNQKMKIISSFKHKNKLKLLLTINLLLFSPYLSSTLVNYFKSLVDNYWIYFFKQIKHTPNIKEIHNNNLSKLVPDYLNMKNYYINETQKGVYHLRVNLLKKATGLVLDLSCKGFPNSICYDYSKVSKVLCVESNTDLLELAALKNSTKEQVLFYKMDETCLEFSNDSFDTVVDTFGLQSSTDPIQQWNEIKRVCKKGGKILLLEFGKSYWLSTNLKLIYNAKRMFFSQGQSVIIDWDSLILHDKSIKVIQKKRKINGRLYYYELEKI